MATVPKQRRTREIAYPTGDGKPMAETEFHLMDLIETILLLRDHFAARPDVYVGGNLLLFYEEDNPRKQVAPDVFVALGVSKKPPRDHYLVWKEGKAPDFIVEITSKWTKREDEKKKLVIYRDILQVREYFLFDPTEDYLHPPLQGFHLQGSMYVPIEPIAGRLPSQVLGLHLERDGIKLRLFSPNTGKYLATPMEAREAADHRAESADRRAKNADQRAEAAETAQRDLAEENERLRRELQALRGG